MFQNGDLHPSSDWANSFLEQFFVLDFNTLFVSTLKNDHIFNKQNLGLVQTCIDQAWSVMDEKNYLVQTDKKENLSS